MSKVEHVVPTVKVTLVKPDRVDVSPFDFESLLIEHQKKYPRTAAYVEKPHYVEALLHPFKRFYRLPFAIANLKLNTILSLRWVEYIKLWTYIVILMLPNFLLISLALKDVKVTVGSAQKAIIGDIVFTVIIPIFIAILLSLFYLKYTHDSYLRLVLAKRIEWIESPVKAYYDKYYDRKLPFNPIIILFSVGFSVTTTLPVLIYSFSNNLTAANIFGILAIIVNPFLYYIFILATYYMIRNTQIYSKVLGTIKKKLSEYIDEYGSLLTKENYEIIWALGNTPTRSIRQLENIPVAGILSALIINLAMIMGGINQMLYGIYGSMPAVSFSFLFIKKGTAMTVLVAVIALIAAAIMVLIIVAPIYLFSLKIKKFKQKALMELDNYLFASVLEFEERYAEFARQETITMFSLREYIASMNTLPISAAKIIQSVTAVVLWFLNVRKIFKAVAGG